MKKRTVFRTRVSPGPFKLGTIGGAEEGGRKGIVEADSNKGRGRRTGGGLTQIGGDSSLSLTGEDSSRKTTIGEAQGEKWQQVFIELKGNFDE